MIFRCQIDGWMDIGKRTNSLSPRLRQANPNPQKCPCFHIRGRSKFMGKSPEFSSIARGSRDEHDENKIIWMLKQCKQNVAVNLSKEFEKRNIELFGFLMITDDK